MGLTGISGWTECPVGRADENRHLIYQQKWNIARLGTVVFSSSRLHLKVSLWCGNREHSSLHTVQWSARSLSSLARPLLLSYIILGTTILKTNLWFSFLLSQRTTSFPDGSVIKNVPAVRETWVRSLGGEDPLEEGMAAYCSILAWRIPWTEEPGGLPWGHRELDTT